MDVSTRSSPGRATKDRSGRWRGARSSWERPPDLAGVAITSILWGVVHLTLGFALAAVWMRMPIADAMR